MTVFAPGISDAHNGERDQAKLQLSDLAIQSFRNREQAWCEHGDDIPFGRVQLFFRDLDRGEISPSDGNSLIKSIDFAAASILGYQFDSYLQTQRNGKPRINIILVNPKTGSRLHAQYE